MSQYLVRFADHIYLYLRRLTWAGGTYYGGASRLSATVMTAAEAVEAVLACQTDCLHFVVVPVDEVVS